MIGRASSYQVVLLQHISILTMESSAGLEPKDNVGKG